MIERICAGRLPFVNVAKMHHDRCMDSAAGQWLRSVTGADTQQGIAERLGVDRTTVSRWFREGFKADAIISAARTCKADPIEGLIATGFLSRDEANRSASISSLDDVPLADLLKAALQRVEGTV